MVIVVVVYDAVYAWLILWLIRIQVLGGDKVAGGDYYPGSFNVKLVSYGSESLSSQHSVSFEIRKAGFTLGDLIEIVLHPGMHRFLFLPYSKGFEDAWKGCRDFMLVIPFVSDQQLANNRPSFI